MKYQEAESLTGITNQQVSKWRRWLKRETEYRAVDEKIDQQREFVGWWDDSVTPNKVRKSVNADPRLQMDEAESLTGITNQQVSKWRRWLKRETEYRAAIYGDIARPSTFPACHIAFWGKKKDG